MSKPRNLWWGYVRGMVRQYPKYKKQLEELRLPYASPGLERCAGGRTADPTQNAALRELPRVKQRELEAVQAAISETLQKKGGKERLRLIQTVFWEQSRTLEGAAMKLYISPTTAARWSREFIYLTAEKYGLLDQ